MTPITKPRLGVYAQKGQTMTEDVFPLLVHFGYRFTALHAEDVAQIKPGDFEVLLCPGGWYFFKDKPERAKAVQTFVREGGGYVGICCGQINACQLGLIPAEMYSLYGIGPTRIEPVDGNHPVLRGIAKKSEKAWRQWDPLIMLRYNGWPMLLREGAHMIAAYDIDKKLAAIAAAQYGKGRAVGFSPHPEGKRCNPGEFEDRDRLSLNYDPLAMNTAPMLDQALLWAAGRLD